MGQIFSNIIENCNCGSSENKEIENIKQDINIIKNNHLHHIEKDVNDIKMDIKIIKDNINKLLIKNG